MSEPRLEDISDYNTLKGGKRKVVWTVILVGLFMGVLYMAVYNLYDNKSDTIKIEDPIKAVPMR
ncbi:MAG: hypothetical protein Q7S59_07720 [Sulfurimonas sp.]|nr:hypothetical protein [Sulfurimonas sp.]